MISLHPADHSGLQGLKSVCIHHPFTLRRCCKVSAVLQHVKHPRDSRSLCRGRTVQCRGRTVQHPMQHDILVHSSVMHADLIRPQRGFRKALSANRVAQLQCIFNRKVAALACVAREAHTHVAHCTCTRHVQYMQHMHTPRQRGRYRWVVMGVRRRPAASRDPGPTTERPAGRRGPAPTAVALSHAADRSDR